MACVQPIYYSDSHREAKKREGQNECDIFHALTKRNQINAIQMAFSLVQQDIFLYKFPAARLTSVVLLSVVYVLAVALLAWSPPRARSVVSVHRKFFLKIHRSML